MHSDSQSPTFSGSVELAASFSPRPELRMVVFDFDGTLSWLRHGWPEIMVALFREQFDARPDETETSLHDLLLELIISLNGKPTIFQMLKFVDWLEHRNGRRLDAESLRAEYQRRLDVEIARRSDQVRSRGAAADQFVVHAARPLLERLRRADLRLVILSSTVEERVREEAELLDVIRYFEPHVYGGVGDPTKFSKLAVFERLLREHNLRGEQLLSFGDGPIELQNTKQLGGVAIAVCSDEDENGSGRVDPCKRQQLLAAGADAVIPDFRDAPTLVERLLGRRLH